ncbi:MAG TPA: tRNA (adenosine(37)-N6)-threonylcarbamoyltransferase complex ATPase subunit type 1 TsaE [Candidatus Paceibacterota bacterium]
MEMVSKSVKSTQKIATEIARKTMENRLGSSAVVVALEGELGAGKTTFVKAFAKYLGVRSHITSPTFVIMKNYKLKSKSYKLLVHIDAYRLRDYRDLLPLGIEEIISNPENIVLIEWAERVSKILPKKYIKIHIDHIDNNSRKITLNL